MSEFRYTPPSWGAGGAGACAGGGGGAGDARHSSGPLRARAYARAAEAPDDEAPAAGAAHTDEVGGGGAAARATEVAEDGADGARADERDDAVEVEGDLDELLKLTAQRDEYLSLAQRTQADFENYKKRVAREAKQSVERGLVKLAKELLPALDNLDRAIAAAASEDPLLEGVRLVRAEIGAALARVGIESYSPVGEPFDPTLHEAVATVEQPEGAVASGSVAEVFQDGYRLGETIIRPARVVVAA